MKTFFQIILFFILLGNVNNLVAQQSRKVDFYYTYNREVYKGSVKLTLKFYHNDIYTSYPEIVNYDEYNPNDIQLKLSISELEWGKKSHNDQLKLAFGDDMNVPIDGIEKTSFTNVYVRNSSKARNLSYKFSSLNKIASSGIALGFVVLKDNATYADVMNSNFSDGKILGFNFNIQTLTIVPKNYVINEEGEVEAVWFLSLLLAEELNKSMTELSYDMAFLLRNEEYLSFEEKFKSTKSKSSSSFLNEKPRKKKETNFIDYDFNAFQKASKTNSISAYNTYLDDYSNGKYASNAKDKIIDLTPFKIKIETLEEGVFKVHEIRFIEGVGRKKPLTIISDNDDWAIKEQWEGNKKLIVKVPPDRKTEVSISLGRKSKKIELINKAEIEEDIQIENKVDSFIDSSNSKNQQITDSDEELGNRANKNLLGIILAVPFIGAIVFLLRKKYIL